MADRKATTRKATTAEDTTPECPPCACTDVQREYGHHHSCIYGSLRFLPITFGVGSTQLVVVGAMNANHAHYQALRVVRS